MEAIFYSYDESATSYGKFCRFVASRKQELAFLTGKTVGLWCDNHPDFIVDLFALWAVDAVPFVISRRMPWDAVCQLLESGQAAGLLTPDVDRCINSPVPVWRSGLAKAPDAELLADLPAIGPGMQAVALILHTSGTTSRPKLVRLTRDNLEASLRFEQSRWQGSWSSSEVTLGWLPLFHSFGLISELLHIYRSKSQYHFGRAEPEALLSALQSGRMTTLAAVPWMLERLVELPGGSRALAQLRWVVVGGAPLSDALRERLVQAGVRVVQQYGMTELGAVFRGVPGGDPRDMSPVIPEQYFQLEQGTGQLVVAEGCPALAEPGPFATRDAFERTPAGYYRFRHRLDDVLVHVSGEKSNAATIETSLRSRLQSQVQHLAVVGAGRLQLACVLQWKQEPSTADRRALLEAFDAVNAELPRHSRLDIDLLVDVGPQQESRFPLSPKGTIVRSLLEREFEHEIAACYQGALGPAAWPPARVDTLRTLPHDAAVSELASLIQEVAARSKRLTGGGRIDPTLGFAEQGFDSLQALTIRLRLGRTLGMELPPSLLFDYPNVTRLAEQLFELTMGSVGISTSDPSIEVDEPIAIVGAACRFPGGATGLDTFWRALVEQRVSVSDIPAERWNAEDWYDPDPDALGRTYVRRASLIEDIAAFDAAFFRISPREATSLDPQQRLLLETTWEALEHACLDPTALRHTPTGVFVGISSTDFSERVDMRDPSAAYAATGSAPSIAAGRISYTLGLHGPSLAVDTACSSSLSAIHLACQSLRRGECQRAVVGAVNLLLSPRTFASLSRLHVLAPDGCSKPFSASADGFGRGEGCGAVVLQRLAEAERQGAPILAVIRGSAMNNDGPSSGLTVPNGPAQQSLVRAALARAGMAPTDIDYVECHGTGTLLGDPIEVQALGGVFANARNVQGPVRIGAVKANLGHLEAAAGLAGLLKVVLCLEHEQLVAQPVFDALNPHVSWSQLPLRVVREPEPWRRTERPRRAGISSFGLGGTNVHVIVEEAPRRVVRPPAPTNVTAPPLLSFQISARSAEALRGSAMNLTTALQERADLRLEDLAYSLCTTRSTFEQRAIVLARSREELGAGLLALRNAENHPQLVQGSGSLVPRVALLFPGQGSQRAQMGRGLYETYDVFRESMDATFSAFSAHLPRPLQEILFAAPGTEESALLDETLYTQPALFSLEVALFRTVQAWGVRPSMLLGHSLGELTAAHVAGVFDLADACRLVAARARLMEQVPTVGAMLAIEATEAEVCACLERTSLLDLAVNGPQACVVSGDVGPIEDFQAHFQTLGRRTSRLQVSLAGHSAHMDSMLAAFEQVASTCRYASPSMPVISNVTGKVADPAVLASPRYWVDQLRRTVRFADGVATLVAQDIDFCLELGPHGTLTALAGGCVESHADGKRPRVHFYAALSRARAEPEALLNALAQLHGAGARIDWAKVLEPWGGRSVRLPTYPFTRTRFWPNPPARSERSNTGGGHPLLGKPLDLASGEVLYTAQLGSGQPGWAGGHRLFGRAILPGTAYVEMAVAAGRRQGSAAIEELTLERPLEVPEHHLIEIQVRVGTPDAQGRRTITFDARDARGSGSWTRHAQGMLRPSTTLSAPARLAARPAVWPPPGSTPVSIQTLYVDLAERGFAYSGAFRGITGVWQRARELFVEASLPAASHHEAIRYGLHPALLDSVLQALATTAAGERFGLPFIWSEVELEAKGTQRLFSRIELASDDSVSLELWNEGREPLGKVAGLLTRAPTQLTDPGNDAATERGRCVDWVPLPASATPGTPLVLDRGADAALLTHTLARSTQLPSEVALPCWGVESPVLETAHAEAKRVLQVLQRWMQDPHLESSRLLVVTSRAVATRQDEDVPDLGHSALWGLVKSAQTEFPHRFLLIDIDDTRQDTLLQSLSLARAHFQLEPQIAVRNGRALAPRVVAAPARPHPPAAAPFPNHGTVLVTGAMGTIGGLVAEHLVVAHGVKHLWLCSRRPFNEELGQSLRAKGADVRFAQCDIGDRDAVAALLSQIPEERPLVAIVHTAAAARDAVLADHGPDHLEKTFRGKLDGAWHLHELTLKSRLSSFVLFSSIAGILGGPGQASYSAANTFLDALAHHRRARGLAGLSIPWGLWAERSGLTRHLRDTIISRMARDGVLPMNTQHALTMMDDSLRADVPMRIAARLDISALESKGQALPAILRQLVGEREVVEADFTELLRSLCESEAEARLLALIREHAAQVMGVSENDIDEDQPMTDLGLDSVMAVELRNRLDTAIGRRLPTTILFKFPSPRVLAQRMRETILDGAK